MTDTTNADLDAVEFETLTLAGLPVARLTRATSAEMLLTLAKRRRGRPYVSTSVNGQVLADAARDAKLREAITAADIINCDGQPIVTASRFVTNAPLPERVATTDLFHDVAEAARARPISMFFLGAAEEQNRLAVENSLKRHPHLNVVGRRHGFHDEAGWAALVREIDALEPDLLWVSLGVPREQDFYTRYADAMPNVGAIKTSGGLFDFLSGHASRAPGWMQACGIEWAYRMGREPRRLAMRYLTTNPVAAMLLLTRSERAPQARALA